MTILDYSLVVVYFVVVIGLGFWYQRRAAHSLESYFLGGKRIPWIMLAMSGSVSNFDITGTMWIVSILYVLGMRSMWHHWMWGVFLGAFFMSYMGKWVRRSGVMTAAEWMETRFGAGRSGRVARTAYAILAVLFVAASVGYAYQGIGKFAAVYIPLENLGSLTGIGWFDAFLSAWEADVLAILIIGATTLYVVLGGLYSVVVTDVIQTVVLTLGAIFIAALAWARLTPEHLDRVPEGWASLSVPWTLETAHNGAGAEFHFFGALVLVWVAKGLLLNAGGPGQMYDFQRFLAARDARDAAKVGAAWSSFLVVRWGMAAGIALLAVTGAMGVEDPEQAMPMILQEVLPPGVRGLVIAGLLAAFMSTFSSTVNSGASFLVRDLWQPYFRPEASEREAVACSYRATVLLVVGGVAIGLRASSIAQIWGWIQMALGAGVVIPNVLRWYWWRMNGWGYAAGTGGGIVLSFIVLLLPSEPGWLTAVWVTFPAICLGSLALCVVVSLATRPVGRDVLSEFFRTVRPFGFWGPVRSVSGLTREVLREPGERLSLTLVNTLLGIAAITGGYLFPMYLVGHWYRAALGCLVLLVISVFALRFTWYRHLPAPEPVAPGEGRPATADGYRRSHRHREEEP